MKSFRLLALAAALVLSYAVAAVAAPVNCTKKIESFDFVVDYSGSMMLHDKQLKKTKIQVTKEALQRVNAAIPNDQFMAGLHTITPNGVIIAQSPWDRAAMSAGINNAPIPPGNFFKINIMIGSFHRTGGNTFQAERF